MLPTWQTWLQASDFDLWLQYLDECKLIKECTDPARSRYVDQLALDREWAAKVNAMIATPTTERLHPCVT